MWESNMAVAFNFPDHNELQVENRSMRPGFVTRCNPTSRIPPASSRSASKLGDPLCRTGLDGNNGCRRQLRHRLYDQAVYHQGLRLGREKGLVNAVGAQYTTSKGENIQIVHGDGKFTLQMAKPSPLRTSSGAAVISRCKNTPTRTNRNCMPPPGKSTRTASSSRKARAILPLRFQAMCR